LRIDVDAGLTGGDQHKLRCLIRISTSPTDAVSLYYRFEVMVTAHSLSSRVQWIAMGACVCLPEEFTPTQQCHCSCSLTHHLTIIAKGQTLTFVVNGTTLANFTDGTYSSGYAALFVSQAKGATTPAQAVFQNLALFPV